MTWHSLPLFVRVAGRPVILLGDGEAAGAKRRLLERAGAVVVADHPEARLAVVALEDEGQAVAAVAVLRARGILVNAVDRPGLCDFTLPAIVDRDPVLVAIGTGGVSAGLAAALRQRLEGLLPAGLGRLADALYAGRERMRAALPDGAGRRRAIAAALRGPLDPLREDPAARVGDWLEGLSHPGEGRGPVATTPASEDSASLPCRSQLGPGLRRGGEVVRMVLASPDPDDLTLRQARRLADADRVIHAPDVPAAILDRARADADRIASDAPPADAEPGLTIWVEMVR